MPAITDSVQFVKGIGPKKVKLFEKLHISTLQDALETYPRDYEDRTQLTRIAVIEEGGEIAGFCKVDLHGDGTGKLDYLVVLPQCRGRKHGKALMDWAMAVFSGSGVRKIEVKVVDGNDAVHLYEKYGFRMNAHILVRGE